MTAKFDKLCEQLILEHSNSKFEHLANVLGMSFNSDGSIRGMTSEEIEKFNDERFGADRPKYDYVCPKCGSRNTAVRERHADTGMDTMECRCSDCEYAGDCDEFEKLRR